MAIVAYSPLRPELILSIGPLVLALAAAASLTVACGYRVVRQRRWRWLHPLGQHGTSELEFALAFPVFLVSVLTTIQIALMVNAHLVVDYAAFCAARSAAVWLPQDLDGEPTLAVAPVDQSEKRSRINRAAALAVLPISPRISRFRFGISIPPAPQEFDATALAQLAVAADDSVDARVDPVQLAIIAADKWVYAHWFTAVELQDESGQVVESFHGKSTITARVTHKFAMATPLAGALLGAALGERYIPLVGGYYVPIEAAYTLMVSPS